MRVRTKCIECASCVCCRVLYGRFHRRINAITSTMCTCSTRVCKGARATRMQRVCKLDIPPNPPTLICFTLAHNLQPQSPAKAFNRGARALVSAPHAFIKCKFIERFGLNGLIYRCVRARKFASVGACIHTLISHIYIVQTHHLQQTRTCAYLSIDQRLDDDHLGGSMHLLYFAGQRMSEARIEPHQIPFGPLHVGARARRRLLCAGVARSIYGSDTLRQHKRAITTYTQSVRFLRCHNDERAFQWHANTCNEKKIFI